MNKRLKVLEWVVLILILFSQVVMNFVVFFTENVSYSATVSITIASLVLCYILQLVRFVLSPVPSKWKYMFYTHLNFFPNYVMGALVIYIYT